MERMTGADNFKNLEKNPLLPPKTSFPSNVTHEYEDCGPSGSKEEPWLTKELIHDQPSSPESISMEEHFSWLIDFLDEPDTPVKICAHRHSSNDLYFHHPQLHSNTHLQTDSKQVNKQQSPQRSRVRKLQYITELENCIQALQAEGLEVLAQLQYADKQNFRLSFENEVLKQRLDSMLQEQLIKCIQNDMLKREVHRLHQQFQQQRPPQPFTIPRSN